MSGELPLYFKSDKDKWSQKHSIKIVGEDFEKRVIETKKDALVFIYHPLKEKNRGLKEKFEQFCEEAKLEGADQKILLARYNGMNESEVFKNPSKLPALVLFRANKDKLQGDDSVMKEHIAFENTRSHMLKTSNKEDFIKEVRDFLHSHSSTL
jgi:hypothetical protein